MPSVPRISGEDAIKAFERVGFVLDRVNGSHHNLKKDGHRMVLTIPCHSGKTLGPGLLKKQITAAGLTVEEFIDLL